MARKTDAHPVLLTSETVDKLIRLDPYSADAAIRKVLRMQPATAPWEFTWHRETMPTYRLGLYNISLEAFGKLDLMASEYSSDDYLRSLLDLPLFRKKAGGRRKPTPRGTPKDAKRFPYDV